jgi:hypothetical protein
MGDHINSMTGFEQLGSAWILKVQAESLLSALKLPFCTFKLWDMRIPAGFLGKDLLTPHSVLAQPQLKCL